MLSFLITVVKLLAIIVAVATVHEFGHFLASKLLKVGVEEFAIGFGPKIVQKKYKGTMYSLRWLPLGGYCAIEGEEPDENGQESETSYQKKKPWEKIIILVMGVTFNFILSFIIFMCVYLPGNVTTTQILAYTEDSVLVEAGLQPNDIIRSINGKEVKLYSQISNFDLPKDVNDVEIQYERDGELFTTMVLDAKRIEGKIGINFVVSDEGKQTNQIELTGAGTSSTKAGIKSGDIVLSVDDVSTPDAISVVNAIKDKAEQEVTIKVQRGEEILDFKLVPDATEVFNLGILKLGTTKSNLSYALIETIENVKNIVGSYADLFTGKVSISNMSGIVGIGEVVSKSEGVLNFFFLMAMISMAVGVANILPFPPLDGGKIVLVLVEAITKKKVSEKVELALSYAGLGALLLLTLFVTYKDIIRII